MTTVELPRSPQRFVLQGVPWKVYQELRNLPENDHVRMTFDEGVLEMMSPSALHERWADLIGQLISVWTVGAFHRHGELPEHDRQPQGSSKGL